AGVVLRLQLVDECEADVASRHPVLLFRGRTSEASFLELGGERRVSRERVGAGPDTAPEDAVERERSSVSTQREANRSRTAFELLRGQALELLERYVRPRRRMQLSELQVHVTGLHRWTRVPGARSAVFLGGAGVDRAVSSGAQSDRTRLGARRWSGASIGGRATFRRCTGVRRRFDDIGGVGGNDGG